jgi:hypothetical protein
MISRLLSWLFPHEPVKGNFHPHDLKDILAYQYRIERSLGCQPTHDKGAVEGGRVRRIVEGEYVDISEHAGSRLHYSDDERQFVAVYPVNIAPEPTPEDVSPERLENLNTSDRQRIDELVDLFKITNDV